ncbi:hypothetical protein [Nocardiopsis sp. NPDC006832]|uniref:hypothetical protein n=1 Tax=Nocardiopsis sp. NPDC006832 TaxID=3157188 RepID=UPI0033EBD687
MSDDRGFRWAGAIVVVVVVLRIAMDWALVVQDEREAFDKVVLTVSEYPDRAALLESEEWSAIDRHVCEEVEEAGHTVMLVEEKESHSGHLDLLVRLEWLPGVFVEIESWEGADLTELRALVGSLRPVEEGDAVTLAEEVTGGPRP